MKVKFLELMKCPYCGTEFNIGDVLERKGGEIINGCVRCECSEFPILEGILNLKIGPLNSYIVKLLKKDEVKKALGLSLWRYSEGICEIVGLLGSKKLMEVLSIPMEISAKYGHRKYLKGSSFYKLLGKNPSESEIYLKHRFSAESLWSVYPFVQILKSRTRILDIGCGSGHTSFIISTYAKPKELVCADRTFRSLYHAKKYFVKDAEFICIDANYPLPFKNNTFDAIFMLDAFHYIYARTLLAREMERLLFPKGLLLLPHLHNSLSLDPAADGKPLSPLNWISLFQQLPVKGLSERNLIEDFLLKNKLDLVKEYSEAELNACNAISLIGTEDRSLFRIYEIENEFLMHKDNLIINPIYSINCGRGKAILQRHFPSESFRREYPLTEKYLPEEYVIDESLSKIIKGKNSNLTQATISEKDLQHIEYLMRKFVVINVPKNYY